MVSISLCMIVKNEEAVLASCLSSVQGLVDEIIIVDTGSADATKEIAENFKAKIFDFRWIDDFAAARNFSFSKAKKDYILWLDADDVILPDDQKKFLDLKETLDKSIDAVNMLYHLTLDESGNPLSIIRRNRLVKRSNNFKWIGAVHEYLEVGGNIINREVAITHKPVHHDSDRNLKIYEKRLAKGESFSPRDLFYYANELTDHQQYDKAIIYYQKFLETKQGWVEDNISACGKLADCFNHLGNEEKEFQYTFKAFEYDTPRAEFCCRLGYKYLQSNRVKEAAFWYKLATQLEKPNSWGPIDHACWSWLPHLQLCVCYDRLGNYKQAYRHNEIARTIFPNNPSILHNKKYLEGILYSKA